ncbi:hypothetical protein DMI62_17875 [Escherichia coli]|nr:hypothetical protein [Escherichia coli]
MILPPPRWLILTSAPVTLQEQMQQTQQRLWQNMAHSEMNGAEVIRELGRLRGSQRQPLDAGSAYQYAGMTLEGMISIRRCFICSANPAMYSRKRRRSGWIIRSWRATAS